MICIFVQISVFIRFRERTRSWSEQPVSASKHSLQSELQQRNMLCHCIDSLSGSSKCRCGQGYLLRLPACKEEQVGLGFSANVADIKLLDYLSSWVEQHKSMQTFDASSMIKEIASTGETGVRQQAIHDNAIRVRYASVSSNESQLSSSEASPSVSPPSCSQNDMFIVLDDSEPRNFYNSLSFALSGLNIVDTSSSFSLATIVTTAHESIVSKQSIRTVPTSVFTTGCTYNGTLQQVERDAVPVGNIADSSAQRMYMDSFSKQLVSFNILPCPQSIAEQFVYSQPFVSHGSTVHFSHALAGNNCHVNLSTLAGNNCHVNLISSVANNGSQPSIKPASNSAPVKLSSGNIFKHREDFSHLYALPHSLRNPYSVKLEDDGQYGNDETRDTLMKVLSACNTSIIPCACCHSPLQMYDQFPLVDGTLFLSPRKYDLDVVIPQRRSSGNAASKAAVATSCKVAARMYLSAVCLQCMVGKNVMRCKGCRVKWDGSSLIIGSMYAYDIFAAQSCCAMRSLCVKCGGNAIGYSCTVNSFCDFSRAFDCAECRCRDHHFVKMLSQIYSSHV